MRGDSLKQNSTTQKQSLVIERNTMIDIITAMFLYFGTIILVTGIIRGLYELFMYTVRKQYGFLIVIQIGIYLILVGVTIHFLFREVTQRTLI